MAASTATVARRLPRGWAHLALQFSFWIGFYVAYQLARGVADRDGVSAAFAHGQWIIDFQRSLGSMMELTFQHAVEQSTLLIQATSLTYWLSQFAVVGLTLLWVYLRRHEWFARFRNTVLLANMLGLIGYIAMPTAPPWMFPSEGFIDGVNHTGDFFGALANPYAAMPSLHAADALIVGIALFGACRRWWSKAIWALWPAWVWFCVLATANHFWLDVLAGILVALLSMFVVSRVSRYRKPAIVDA